MVIRTIANRVGTFEIEGNTISYLQPLSTFNTQEMNQVQKWYKDKMQTLQKSDLYLPARDISFQSGQVCYTFDVTGLQSFNVLKKMYLEDKLPYYLSLIQLAKEKQVQVLWETENLVIDVAEASVKALVIEHQAFTIENEKSRLNAVKELIIISLTNLQQVYGRPKRNDFFEQSEEVIQFAEMIYLRLDSLDHMASFIQSLYDEIEERKQREQEELAQQLANKKRFSIPNLIPFQLLQQKSEKRPELRKDVATSLTKQKSISQKESKMRFLIGTAIILVGALLLNILLTSANKNTESSERRSASRQEETDVEKVYLNGLLGDTEGVMKVLEERDYDRLNKDETKLLHQLWIKHGSYDKYMAKDELAVSYLTEYMTDQDLPEELDRLQVILKVANPHIDFAKGVLAKEWKEVLANRDLVELTEERKTHIITAFLNEKDIDGAKAFVSEKAPKDDGLMNRVLTAEKNQVEMAALEEEKALLQKTIEESEDADKVSAAKQKMGTVKNELDKLKKSSGL
ncbi:hypothetical protein [Paenisporosarcina sp. OV554]|uniref:hypothetical protein n=1 Tax=Paenisporosarcina sp. OV554 TaxID=2135694 RepID=UPI000D3A9215|nr:hypothetical protein [Paenisporosarcina sp. OV554]PUB09468.1 hypothetical protein C8K15_13020 [Paenisporosarcina sp. OV554]